MAIRPTVMFVHGALVRDAEWWWSAMRTPLADHGIDSRVVALPSCGETGGEPGDLAADVAATRDAITAVDGPVLLVGHSYGGTVITGAGDAPAVRRLVYVSSVMPRADESQGQVASDHPAPWVVPDPDTATVSADPALIRELFLQDCDPATTEAALARLTPQPMGVFGEAPGAAAWEDTPSTFVVCTRDLAFPPEVQRRRIRERTTAIDFDAGHHPFLSRPAAFADLLAEVAEITA